jgi:2-methylisocitrate lyase-like PEP mutase family enzyme
MSVAASANRLRTLLAETDLVVAPGCYDAITARLTEQAGYPAVYMTGAGTSAAKGYPDYGLLTLTEMAEAAGVLARSVGVPVISDADTGYGNELNVTRAVREFEGRGVAAIHIEDQVSPKRCGHLDGKEVVSMEEFVSKIRAAVAARRDPDFLIIARTDARAVIGFDEAIARANAAIAMGADMAFVEAVQTLEEMAEAPRRVSGPCLLNHPARHVVARGDGRHGPRPTRFEGHRDARRRAAQRHGRRHVPALWRRRMGCASADLRQRIRRLTCQASSTRFGLRTLSATSAMAGRYCTLIVICCTIFPALQPFARSRREACRWPIRNWCSRPQITRCPRRRGGPGRPFPWAGDCTPP